MDINLLVVSVGNSRLALGTFIGGELRHATRIPHDKMNELPAALTEAWKAMDGRDNVAIVGASVRPELNESIATAAMRATNQRMQWVGREIDLPREVLTDEPNQTGVDRVLNIAAAYEQMEKACVVVDAGTAITIDCCNDNGDFLGGAIVPGTSLMLDALHEKTALLPRVELNAPQGLFGKSTEQAILHGVYYGIRGMVKEIVENYATELGTWPDVIATGGDAAKLFEGWELIHAIAPDLTLYGIALAFTEHHIKHGT
ncbi:MAG TPA: type III pantothenate kinase [Tepidisphaeraceae bacterium]|jgi:type III pantothenate kinase|nr:type III pantothenate kinase [Tepidisphaeraceae bacterium]